MPIQPLQNIKLTFKCPRQLNDLQPCNGDWYCDGCQKIVHDFRGMTEQQILKAIGGKQTVCGLFKPATIEVLPRQNKWLRWVSAAMLALGLTSCYNMVMGQTGKSEDVQNTIKIDTPEIVAGVITLITRPEFPGGEVALKKYLHDNLKNLKGLRGNAIVGFTVCRDGSVTDVKIISTSVPSFNPAIIKALKQMPMWKPGFESGHVIQMQYSVPINFSGASK